MPTPDFDAAARRHHRDAEFLLGDARWANADHLAGLAAECGLKTILEGWYGATLSGGFLTWNQRQVRSHVSALWGELAIALTGRAGATLIALLQGSTPFAGWDVADRYSDGTMVTEQGARDHAGMAREVIEIIDQARRDGIAP